MAEGWARHLKGDLIEPYSAGIEKHGLNPTAVKVMAEAGVDISSHHSKVLEELAGAQFDRLDRLDRLDYVITVCDNASERCPVFPGKAKVIHKNFDDPPKLSEGAESEEEILGHYRRVRDEIRDFIRTLPPT